MKSGGNNGCGERVKRPLLTIGYEGCSLEDFLETLRSAHVSVLLDVRELAISRRKGFAKRVLSTALESIGITYVHLKGLGDPREGRIALRMGNYGRFLKIFEKHMGTREARTDLMRAEQFVRDGVACLMCYERTPDRCHRTIVTRSLSNLIDLSVRHLRVAEGISRGSGKIRTRKNSKSREGIAARR